MRPLAVPIAQARVRMIRLVLFGTEVALGRGEHLVGRGSTCNVCFDDPAASRRHAMIEVLPDRATIRDLGSRNGVLVNGDPIDGVRELADGDRIALGSQVLVVREICRGPGDPLPRAATKLSRSPEPRVRALANAGEPSR